MHWHRWRLRQACPSALVSLDFWVHPVYHHIQGMSVVAKSPFTCQVTCARCAHIWASQRRAQVWWCTPEHLVCPALQGHVALNMLAFLCRRPAAHPDIKASSWQLTSSAGAAMLGLEREHTCRTSTRAPGACGAGTRGPQLRADLQCRSLCRRWSPHRCTWAQPAVAYHVTSVPVTC
jgi:hypothetical protein